MTSENQEERREAFKVWAPTLAIVLIGFVVAWQFVDPPPPSTISMATAAVDGSYHASALRYQQILAKKGLKIELRPSAGSLENIELLQKKEVDCAFIQSGTRAAAPEAALRSLTSVYLEPIWIFYRSESSLEGLLDLRGLRINVGPAGSGTRALALQLLEANGLTTAPTVISELPRAAAVTGLKTGTLDAAIFIISPQAPVVRELLSQPGIRLLSLKRMRAYQSAYPFLIPTVLGEGMVDMAKNVPKADVSLLSTTACIVARTDFHPALVPLMIEAALEVHQHENLFLEDRGFPTDRFGDFEINQNAQRYFASGRTFIYRVLPFRVASFVDRMKVLLLPLVTLLIPLMKLAPPLYRWRVRRRIFRWYRQLRDLDNSAEEERVPEALIRIEERVRQVEQEARGVKVPLSYTQELYHLKLHTWLVREKLRRRLGKIRS